VPKKSKSREQKEDEFNDERRNAGRRAIRPRGFAQGKQAARGQAQGKTSKARSREAQAANLARKLKGIIKATQNNTLSKKAFAAF